jgi:acetyl-CoA carboxylase biotin carboxyl carrier protein
MDYKKLQQFIDSVVKTGAAEVIVESEDMKITIRTQMPNNTVAATPVIAQPPVVPQQQVASPVQSTGSEDKKVESADEFDESKFFVVKSPMVGTFYRKPAPDKPPFVNVGDEVKKGQILCLIEAMKLFNEVESEIDGKIVKILVDDASPVEFDQPLFLIEPV